MKTKLMILLVLLALALSSCTRSWVEDETVATFPDGTELNCTVLYDPEDPGKNKSHCE